MRTVLFVCTGNTCRSPMAEAIAQSLIHGGLLGAAGDYLAVSAGVAAFPGMPASPETVDALRRHGIEHDGRSKPVTPEMVREADAVVCMTASHAATVRAMVDEGGDVETATPITTLLEHEDVPDPIGQGQDAYDALAELLLKVLPERLKEVLAHEDRTRV